MLSFQVLDVFTEKTFSGNPLAVVTVPPNMTLTSSQKHTIAKEFNLSETVFVQDVEDRSSMTERSIEIFTPVAEIPFAGHPTIGAAVFLQAQNVRTLVVKAGRIDLDPSPKGFARAAIPYHTRLHQMRLPSSCVNGRDALQESIARAEEGAPLFSIVNGMTFALIELPSLDLLNAVQVGIAPDLPAELLDDEWRHGWVTRRYYFVRLNSETIAGRSFQYIRTRLIKLNMEDAATGSAACALSSYLSIHELKEPSITFKITQGVEMGRDSELLVDVEVAGTVEQGRLLQSLHLGGRATNVMTGSIHIPPIGDCH